MLYRVTASAPTGVPIVAIDAAKQFLRVTNAYDDQVIQGIIDAADEWIANECNRIFRLQAMTLTTDYVPGGELEWWDGVRDGALSSMQRWSFPLINPPLQSVVEVATYDLNNVRSVYDPANYFIDQTDPNQFARICLNLGSIWPVNLRRYNAVEVLITAGYPDGQVPKLAILAMNNIISYLYEHRGEEAVSIEKSGAAGIIRSLKVYSPTVQSPGKSGRIGRLW